MTKPNIKRQKRRKAGKLATKQAMRESVRAPVRKSVAPPGSSAVLAANVRRLRLEKGLSQGELAKLCDLPQPRISDVEAGRRDRRLGTVSTIANALGVPVDVLVRPFMLAEAACCHDDEMQGFAA